MFFSASDTNDMTSILSNIGVNFSRKSTKKAAATAANQHPVNGAANYSPATTPLGSSPPMGGGVNTFFTSLTSSRNNNANSGNVINSNCATCSQGCHTSSSKDVACPGASPGSSSTPKFHISSLPSTKIVSSGVANASSTCGGGGGGIARSAESSPCESADEISCSISSNLAAASNTTNNVPYLTCCTTQERRERYKECKSMVQLPRGFDKLEWLAYHGSLLVVLLF